MSVSLKTIAIGHHGKVVGYQEGQAAYRKRLLSMGLTPGTEFHVVRAAPMGDPIEIKLRGFNLTLRKDEAEALLVEELVK